MSIRFAFESKNEKYFCEVNFAGMKETSLNDSIDPTRNMLYLRIHYFKYFQFIIFEFFSKLKRFEMSIKITNYIYFNERDDLKFMIDNSCLSFHQFDNRMQLRI